MNLKPYPEYKDSGVAWLGKIPAHWDAKALRVILKQRNEKNDPIKTTQILSLSIARGVTLYSHEGRGGNKAKNDLTAYKIARVGDIVLNSMNVVVGAVGLSKYTGAISPVYYALYPRSQNVDIHYFNKVFSNSSFQRYLLIYGKGILIKKSDSGKLNTIRMKISPDDLKKTLLPLPTLEEQTQIARFLDWKTAQINKFIRNKRRLIELLKEQKQNIINQAMTRGLNPNVKLKPSGVEWLGNIPEHWEVTKVGRVIDLLTGFPFKSEGFVEDGQGTRLLRGVNISPEAIRWDETVAWKRQINDQLDNFELREGDIVIGMDRPIISLGIRVALVTQKDLPSLLLQRVARIRPKAEVTTEYLLFLFGGRLFLEYIAPIFTGISVPHLSPDQIRNFKILLPPLYEQKSIVSIITEETETIDYTITRAEKEIELIKEYRTRLISDVVTGKVDVRDIEVPEVSEEELLTLTDETTESDALIDEAEELDEITD